MTSTNDGKEVKSNQTSGPKGKTYFIELYKSLDARLNEPGTASDRTSHLCDAWRRVHSLCLHSAPTTHPHLLSWLQRHTARVVLQTTWQSQDRKDERSRLEEAINVFIVESRASAVTRDGESPAWETQLVARGEWFKKILDHPWKHPVLNGLLNQDGTPPTDDEVLEWLKEERGVTFVMRLQTLVAEKKCDDIAILLATAVLERVRKDTVQVSDADQSEEVKNKPEEALSFGSRLKEEAGFTVDVWEMLTDIEFVLLHKRDSSRCIALAKQTPLRTAYQLIERLQSRLETSPREKRLWKNSKEVAVLIAQVVIARCMVVQQCSGGARSALYCCARSLARLMAASRLPSAAAALAAPAPTAAHLHTLAAAIDAQLAQNNESSMKPFVCELYVRAITAGMNELERLKLKTEKDTEARLMEQTLASWFVQLGCVLASSDRVKCECALTAFSVHPSPQMYERIKAAPLLPPILLDSVEQSSTEATNPEFGSWASDSRSQTNFVKTSETLNMKARQNQANVLSTAILNEGEALGLSPELCQDITVLLSGPRVKTLSWDMERELLLENCRAYLERTHGGTKAVTTELKYLNLNPDDFQYLPEEDEDENNIYYGIEKGYEHLVEHEPEGIWEDAYEDLERTETSYSTDEYDFVQPQRKKKTKKIVLNADEDPLSTMAEAKRKEKKERPHSKERSREKKKVTDLLVKMEDKVPGDPLEIKEGNQDKKKDKPKRERKKKEKAPKPDGALSSLVGLKVAKPKKKAKNPLHFKDSDADNQATMSMQSLNYEDNVQYDGQFYMDDIKSPRSSHSDGMAYRQDAFSVANESTGITYNSQHAPLNMPHGSPSAKHVPSPSSYTSPSDYLRNNSPTLISEEVKSSISKLLEQRRLEADRKKPNAIIRLDDALPMDKDNITPKGVAIPEIPKSYISKQQSDKLIELKQKVDDILKQRKNTAIPSPVIQYASKNFTSPGIPIQSSSQYNAASQYNNIQKDRMTPSSSDRCFSTPPSSERFMDSVNMVSIYDKNEPSHSRNRFVDKSPYSSVSQDRHSNAKASNINYQNYLHEYHKLNTYNHYAEKIEPTKKVMRPVSKVTPVVPNVKSEHKTPQSAKQMSQKPDGSLNTFSRLSYYKNKQTDKNKAQDMSQQNLSQTVGAKLDGFIMEHLRQSESHPLSQLNDVQPMVKHEKLPMNTSQHPIMANILQGNLSHAQYQHKSVIPPKTILSDSDENDLLLLLRQKNMLNKPHNSPIASCSKTVTHNTQNSPIATCSKAVSSSTDTIYESNPGHMNLASSPSLRTSNPSLMASSPSLTTSNPGLMTSSPSLMTTNPGLMTSNPGFMTASPSLMTSNSGLMTSNPSLMASNPSLMPLNSTFIPSNHLSPKPHIGKKKTKEGKIINVLSTSIIKSADPKTDSKHKPANTNKSTGQGKSKKAEAKGQKKSACKPLAAHKDPEEWENVLDALKKQKTPCRGPNALDLALNKSSFEKAFEDSLRNPSTFFTSENNSWKESIIDYDHEQFVKPTNTVNVSSSSGNIQNTNKKSCSLLKPNLSEPKKHSKMKKCANALNIEKLTQNQIDQSMIEKLMLQNQIVVTRKNSNIVQDAIPEKTQKRSNIIKPSMASYVEPPKMVEQPNLVEMPVMNEQPSLIETNKKAPKQNRAEIPKKDVKQIVIDTSKKEVKQVADIFKKIPQDIKVKQFIYSGTKPDDSFISGIRNSDYDLLDELMDDDLRKEIGELSSDEEDYNAAQGFLKDNKAIDQPVKVEYNPPPKGFPAKAPPVVRPPLCKQNDMKQTFTQKPTQQQPNHKESTLAKKASTPTQNTPGMCLNVANVQNVTTHIVTKPTQAHNLSNANNVHSTQITVERNIYVTAVPHSAPNVMIIPPDLVYEGYSSVQTPIQTVTNIAPKAYMAVNTPSISIYQTTQFAAPLINPLIIASAVTVPTVNNVQCVTAVQSTSVTNVTESQYYYPNSDLLQLAHIATAQEKLAVEGNKLEARESNIIQDHAVENDMQRKHESKTPTDININKSGERKVLQEVQEKQADEKIDCKRRGQKLEDNDTKTQADYERLIKKRMAILNRNISHFCGVKTIALGYSPLRPSITIENKELEIVDNKSSEEEDFPSTQNNLQDLCNDVKSPATPDSFKENKSEPVRRILLRSSNKLKITTRSPTSSPKRCVDKKLKTSPAVLLDTPNQTSIENNQSDIETTNKSKRVSKRIRNKSDTTPKDNKGTEVASKMPGKKATPKVPKQSKPKNNQKSIVNSAPNKDFDTDFFFDIEAELLGSTIPKIASSDLHIPDLPEVISTETDVKEEEQSPDKEEAVSLPIQEDQLQHNKDIPVNTFDTNIDSTVIPATDLSTTNKSEQIIENISETTDESNNLAEDKIKEKETEVVVTEKVMLSENINNKVEKEILSKVNEFVSESIIDNGTETNNVKKLMNSVLASDVSIVPEKISPTELMDTSISPKVQTPVNITENEKAQTLSVNEIKNVESSAKVHDNDKNSVGQIKSTNKNTDFNKSSTIVTPQIVTSADGGDDDDDIQIIEDLSSNTSPTHIPKPPQSKSLKDNIIIENVANADTSDPLKKTVRIKLGNGKTFKGTISGSVNIDSLLRDPQIQSLLKSQLEQSKKLYSLKLNINKNISNGNKILSSHIQSEIQPLKPLNQAPLETVSLLSDDEDETSQVFETEYGKHMINSLDPELFTKHQTKLKLKSYVMVKKLSKEEENAIKRRSETNMHSNKNVEVQQTSVILDEDVVKINLQSPTSLQIPARLNQTIMSAAIPTKYVKGIFSDIENILAPVNQQLEPVVLIDDSSNDSVTDEQKPEPKEKIDEFKNMLLKDLGVINNIIPARSKSKDGMQMIWASEAIDLTDDSVIESITNKQLDEKEIYHEIINRQCFVKLVRCDQRVHKLQSELCELEESKAEENYADVPALRSRSGSFSILDEFPLVDDIIKSSNGERNISSPVMEVYEKIASLEGKFPTNENTYQLSVGALKCDTEWMVTKKIEHLQCLNGLEHESLQTLVVPKLSSLVLNFIQDGDLFNKYVPIFHRSPISLKRKSKPSLFPNAKISKFDYKPNEPQSNDCSRSSTITLDLSATDASIVTVTEVNLTTDSPDITSDLSEMDVTVSDYNDSRDINNEELKEEQVVVSKVEENIVINNLASITEEHPLNEISKDISAETSLVLTVSNINLNSEQNHCKNHDLSISVKTDSLHSPEIENDKVAAFSQSEVMCEDYEMDTNQLEAPSLIVSEELVADDSSTKQELLKDGLSNQENSESIIDLQGNTNILCDNADNTAVPIDEIRVCEDNEMESNQLEASSLKVKEGLFSDVSGTEKELLLDNNENEETIIDLPDKTIEKLRNNGDNTGMPIVDVGVREDNAIDNNRLEAPSSKEKEGLVSDILSTEQELLKDGLDNHKNVENIMDLPDKTIEELRDNAENTCMPIVDVRVSKDNEMDTNQLDQLSIIVEERLFSEVSSTEQELLSDNNENEETIIDLPDKTIEKLRDNGDNTGMPIVDVEVREDSEMDTNRLEAPSSIVKEGLVSDISSTKQELLKDGHDNHENVENIMDLPDKTIEELRDNAENTCMPIVDVRVSKDNEMDTNQLDQLSIIVEERLVRDVSSTKQELLLDNHGNEVTVTDLPVKTIEEFRDNGDNTIMPIGDVRVSKDNLMDTNHLEAPSEIVNEGMVSDVSITEQELLNDILDYPENAENIIDLPHKIIEALRGNGDNTGMPIGDVRVSKDNEMGTNQLEAPSSIVNEGLVSDVSNIEQELLKNGLDNNENAENIIDLPDKTIEELQDNGDNTYMPIGDLKVSEDNEIDTNQLKAPSSIVKEGLVSDISSTVQELLKDRLDNHKNTENIIDLPVKTIEELIDNGDNHENTETIIDLPDKTIEELRDNGDNTCMPIGDVKVEDNKMDTNQLEAPSLIVSQELVAYVSTTKQELLKDVLDTRENVENIIDLSDKFKEELRDNSDNTCMPNGVVRVSGDYEMDTNQLEAPSLIASEVLVGDITSKQQELLKDELHNLENAEIIIELPGVEEFSSPNVTLYSNERLVDSKFASFGDHDNIGSEVIDVTIVTGISLENTVESQTHIDKPKVSEGTLEKFIGEEIQSTDQYDVSTITICKKIKATTGMQNSFKHVDTKLSDEIICKQPKEKSPMDDKSVLLENIRRQPIIFQKPQDFESAEILEDEISTNKTIITPDKANFKLAVNKSTENNTNNLPKYSNSNTRSPQTTDEIIDALNKIFGESEGTVVFNEIDQDKIPSLINKHNEYSNSEQNETCDLEIELSKKFHDIDSNKKSNEVCIDSKLKHENITKHPHEESPAKQETHFKHSATHVPQTSDEVFAALHKMFGEPEDLDSGATEVVITKNNELYNNEIDEVLKLNGNNDEINDSVHKGKLTVDSGSEILVEGEVDMLDEEIIENITFSRVLDSTHDVKEICAPEDSESNQNSVSSEENDQNIIAKKLTSITKEVPEIDIKGIVYDDPDIGKRYVFSLIKEVSEDSEQDKQSDTSKENIANNSEDEITEDLKLVVPKFTYAYSSTILRVRRSSRNMKRKKDMSDIKTSEKKYRKGKNIDYPKVTQSAIAELAYAKEYKRIMDYCSTIKFSYARPFHIEHIEVGKMLKAWPIQKCHTVDVNDSKDVEDLLYMDIEDTENTVDITDPLKQTLNDEIVNGNHVNYYKPIDINETNFNMGFGERSGRVIQKLETGIKKLSAATLSDVKQYQPFSSSKANIVNQNIAHELETQKVKLARFMNLINKKERVQSFFKELAFELNKEFLQDKKNESNDIQLSNFPFGLTSSEFMEVPMETVVNVVQVGQLPVSTNAQNPITCDPRVTHVSDASPSQCSNNSPGEDSQAAIETEYTELTTANITLPLVQEYAHHHQSPPSQEQSSPKNDDDENMSTLSIVKIELMEEDTEENQENDIYENDFSPLPNNNVEYSFEDTSNTLFNTSANVDNTSTNTHNTSTSLYNTSSNMDNSFTNMFNNSTNMDNTYTTPSSMESTYTNMDNASTSVYSTSSNMGNSSTEMDNTNHRNDASPDMDNRTTNNLDNNSSTDMNNSYTSMYNPMATESNDMSNTTTVCNATSNMDNSPIDLENRSTNVSTSPNIENSDYDYTYENIEDYAANIENNNNPDNYSTNVDNYPSNVENYSTNVNDYGTNVESYSSNVENFATNAENFPTGVDHFSTNIENFPTNAENYATNIDNTTSNVDNNMTGIDNSTANLLEDTQPQDLTIGNSAQESKICEKFEGLSPESETARRDQIAHAMNAAGISSESVITSGADELANLITQSAQATANNYSKSTPINVMTLQQALAQVLPPPLNQTGTSENQMPNNPNPVAQQVLHIVQGNNAPTVINKPNGTHLLHIVQNKNNPNANGLSLVDAGLQQGGNQLIHIVNNGNQNNAQFLKRVNLLTNLTNAQGSNEQKMIQFVCKSADGKSIQLNAGHQRSMVLRLHPTNVQTPPKPAEPQDLSATTSAAANPANNQDSPQGIKSRSVYEENYAQFIQDSAPTPGSSTTPCQEKATSLPKFNQVFGKQAYQDNQNEMDHNGLQENSDCPPEESNSHIEQPTEVNDPPLLVRNAPPETTQAQPNSTQPIKKTVSPMNIHTTMHGGVIYTRQIPVNIGGGQTINLITVPSTELVDDAAPKQQTEGTFVHQEKEQSSIIKLVPHNASNNSNVSPEENNVQAGPSNETNHIPQPQPVLTQMRIKLPMLSKGPHIVPGARLVRPSFFQIQRNVIAGTNQPVYQQLVLTTAPSLGQTIRLPSQQPQSDQSPQAQPILVQAAQHTQPSPHIPVQQVQHAPSSQHVHSAQQAHSTPLTTQPQSVQSDHTKPDNKPDSELSTLTLEQLREFDMVLEQVKERSVQPTPSTTPNTPVQTKPTPADSTDGPALATTSVSESTQQVLYSVENNQPSNVVSYVNRKSTITSATKSFVRSPDSSGIVDTPTSSSQVQITHTVTSKSTTVDGSTAVVPHPKKKKKKKSSSSSSALASLGSPSKSNSLKPQEDEQTTQRILYILAEYKEQVENSPDKNKPAPRRRNQFPPTTGSKRKRSHCSSRAMCRREGTDMSPMHDHGENGEDSLITLGSEDSSCGTTFSECTDCQESHSPEQDSPTKVVRRLTFEQETTTQITQTRTIPQRNVIVGDGQTITVARTTTATTAKPTTTVLMPANYLLPVSMIKGGQQIAIMTNRGPKILVGAGDTNAGALLFQRLIGPGLKPVLARPGVRHIRLPATALHNLQTFNIQTTPVTQVQPPDSTAQPAPTPAPPDLIDTRAMSSPWQEREAQDKPIRGPSPDCTEPWNMPSSSIADDYGYEEIVRTDNMERTVLDAIPDRYSPDMEAQRIFDKMFDVDSKKSMYDSPRCGYDIDTSDGDDKPYQQVVQQRKDGRHHRVTHVSTAALRHKYAILEHELRLQKSLSEECEDLGVDSPSASDLFPEADILFGAPSPAHEQTIDQCNTPPPIPMHQSIPQPDLDDQIATDHLLTHNETRNDDIDLNLDDVGEIVTVGEDGVATIPSINAEEFARSHPNTTFHTEPEEGEITISQPPFTIAQSIKGRHITFHANRVPGTVVMAPQTTVISQAIVNTNDTNNTVKFTDIDNMLNAMPSHQTVTSIPSVLVKDPGPTTRPLSKFDSLKEPSTSTSRPLAKYDSKFDSLKEPSVSTSRPLSKFDKFDTLKEPSIPTSRPSSKYDAKFDSLKEPNISTSKPASKYDSKFDNLKEPSVSTPTKPLSKFDSLLTESKLHLSNTSARQIVHSTGHGTQVIRRLRYDERTNTRTNTRFHFEEPRAKTSISDEVKMRNDRAMVESMGDNASSPGQPELFWDSTTTERHERRFHFSESEKVTKSPFDELLNDSSAYGPHTRLDSVIKAARPERTYGRTSFEGISVSESPEETRPLRTYPPKRVHTQHTQDMERHFTLKTTTTTTHHHELGSTTKTSHHQEDRSKKNLPRCQESEGRRRTGRGLVKRGCSCCTGSSAPPKKRSRPKKSSPSDFTTPNS